MAAKKKTRRKTKKKAKKTAKSKSPAFDLVVKMLTRNPKVQYADVRAAAERRGYKIFPIVYGRAKKLLGMTKPGGVKRKATARRASAGNGRRRPGRPRTRTAAMDSLESVISMMKDGEREREQFRRALLQIRDLIDGVV